MTGIAARLSFLGLLRMKFSTRQDTELAAEQLFNVVSDFDRIERIMLRRGAEVRRIDPRASRGPEWHGRSVLTGAAKGASCGWM
ncbi:hypothetical protein QWZ10_04640 [Paracoccus cavernae]|uniref:Uncharacterized protein n=1 Tax=Paracoccus cavernae TaxID=1571207 RepID=A0ABT8D4W3_9RHOB|nr:hypothetical protein [Paracoccus cavernae]